MATTVHAGIVERTADEPGTAEMGRLFDAHHARLYRLARRLSGSREDAHDLVQDTFLRIARSRRQVPHGPSAEEAWLVRVLVNLARDSRRRSAVRARHSLVPEGGEGNLESSYVARMVVHAALARLDARRRAVVVLHEMEGESVEQIGAMLGIAAVTVRWHLFRARKELSRILRQDRPEKE